MSLFELFSRLGRSELSFVVRRTACRTTDADIFPHWTLFYYHIYMDDQQLNKTLANLILEKQMDGRLVVDSINDILGRGVPELVKSELFEGFNGNTIMSMLKGLFRHAIEEPQIQKDLDLIAWVTNRRESDPVIDRYVIPHSVDPIEGDELNGTYKEAWEHGSLYAISFSPRGVEGKWLEDV